MPIYVYKNLTTGERFEIEQRITEPPLEEHPTTGDPVKRLIQPVGIAFKGSGFYATDSRSSGSAKPGSTTAPDAASAKESTSSDSTPAKPAASEGAKPAKPSSAKPSSSDS